MTFGLDWVGAMHAPTSDSDRDALPTNQRRVAFSNLITLIILTCSYLASFVASTMDQANPTAERSGLLHQIHCVVKRFCFMNQEVNLAT